MSRFEITESMPVSRESILGFMDDFGVSPLRRLHTFGVEQTAVTLALLWGVSPHEAGCAALLHDIMKGKELYFCSKYVIPDVQIGFLRHAVEGAIFALCLGAGKKVANAVRWHTTGRAGMSSLEKIVYLADKIEPQRDFMGINELRRMAYVDLDRAVLACVDLQIDFLKQKGYEIHPDTLSARDDILLRVK